MSRIRIKKSPMRFLPETGEPEPQALFPEVYEIANLKVDKQLPILKFNNLIDSQTTSKAEMDVEINVPVVSKVVDLFLFVDHYKLDMFYQIFDGKYSFRKVQLHKGENLIEFFYRIGGRRSSSVNSVVIRK